jgi:hypothetical protein
LSGDDDMSDLKRTAPPPEPPLDQGEVPQAP